MDPSMPVISESNGAKSLTGPQLHQAVDQLTADAQSGYNVHQNRDNFQERALRDATMSSNESALMLDPNNPILVREEMKAQKDYFRKLKFTYLEQDAKRHFLASITGDEPQRVEPGENEERELINAEKKERLKAAKAGIEDMRTTSVKLAEQNAKKHEEMSQQLVEAQTLQKQIRDMELELARIKATHPPENRMTVNQANDTLDAQIVEIQQLTDEREATQAQIDQTSETVARIAKELQRLSRDREREEARAREVREGREAGDTKVDDICRWLTSSMSFYRSLLGIRSVRAVSETELHLEYDVPQGPVILVMKFDELTKRLADAALIGSDIDVAEAVGIAAGSNDVPGLIADVLAGLRS
ncbi:hypothetical protein I307_05009 [Cryptococcus deuterogattii 99/473]|uniref:Unplaced genomic scaffold supercont1.17, whole genome shotgun sequence n=2 Tax=Cryptococcus deuterogattii TaxID=1859096 RepID=A0A0D0SY27_9TREE|nr:hypothetical protein CNBG_0116 [Cryptococcus deuterogattii R265]KIR26859.1 hypothetical protein I309_04237 [Cryptococcus deuterogattii LA55]KIR32412.1 hypothetical protein I352_05239 [Cryptococcus deuterogattii MMRL2647]KIR38067.1 hypothetical protein I313_06062 [Cryptococcus deuterogattii Ram5]KIR74114.1 hypothetical protein I310_01711 [Cryptococcus deuterogattii CA1014]KIR94399.1 hypothetical protein I304_02041 [Cryptococcus deuterogattii CBS 10090]KIR96816.1 hypothetical protein L804_05